MNDTTNGWPGKPGVPLNPEKEGWHWVYNSFEGLVIHFWGATFSEWDGYPLWIVREWTYHGPCLTPDQATALQARVAELEGSLDQLLDDMREGLCVCQQAKDEARAALEGKKDE